MYMYSIPPTAELYIDLFLYLKNQHIAISLVAPSRVYLWNQKYPTFSPPQFFSLPFISLYFLILFSVLPSSSLTCGYILGLVNTWAYEYINTYNPYWRGSGDWSRHLWLLFSVLYPLDQLDSGCRSYYLLGTLSCSFFI